MLDIDHKDGNPTNHDQTNLRLLCRGCNTKTSLARQKGIGTFGEREGEKGRTPLALSPPLGTNPTDELKNRVDYSIGSPEMQVSDYTELNAQNWLIAKLRRDQEITKKEAHRSIAWNTGIAINTARNIVEKMLAESGPIREHRVAGQGTTVLKLKQAFLTDDPL